MIESAEEKDFRYEFYCTIVIQYIKVHTLKICVEIYLVGLVTRK